MMPGRRRGLCAFCRMPIKGDQGRVLHHGTLAGQLIHNRCALRGTKNDDHAKAMRRHVIGEKEQRD